MSWLPNFYCLLFSPLPFSPFFLENKPDESDPGLRSLRAHGCLVLRLQIVHVGPGRLQSTELVTEGAGSGRSEVDMKQRKWHLNHNMGTKGQEGSPLAFAYHILPRGLAELISGVSSS